MFLVCDQIDSVPLMQESTLLMMGLLEMFFWIRNDLGIAIS